MTESTLLRDTASFARLLDEFGEHGPQDRASARDYGFVLGQVHALDRGGPLDVGALARQYLGAYRDWSELDAERGAARALRAHLPPGLRDAASAARREVAGLLRAAGDGALDPSVRRDHPAGPLAAELQRLATREAALWPGQSVQGHAEHLLDHTFLLGVGRRALRGAALWAGFLQAVLAERSVHWHGGAEAGEQGPPAALEDTLSPADQTAPALFQRLLADERVRAGLRQIQAANDLNRTILDLSGSPTA